MKLGMGLAVIIFLLSACAIKSQDIEDVNMDNVSARSWEVKEIVAIDESTEQFKRVRVDFLIPENFTKEDVEAHAREYIEQRKAADEELMVLALWYYDDLVYQKYQNSLAAAVLWAPNGAYSNSDNIPNGDYSKHILSIDFNPLDSNYGVTASELDIYDRFQSQYIKQVGISRPDKYEKDLDDYEKEIFETISDQIGVPLEELIEICHKVSLRRWVSEN